MASWRRTGPAAEQFNSLTDVTDCALPSSALPGRERDRQTNDLFTIRFCARIVSRQLVENRKSTGRLISCTHSRRWSPAAAAFVHFSSVACACVHRQLSRPKERKRKKYIFIYVVYTQLKDEGEKVSNVISSDTHRWQRRRRVASRCVALRRLPLTSI